MATIIFDTTEHLGIINDTINHTIKLERLDCDMMTANHGNELLNTIIHYIMKNKLLYKAI